MASRIKARGCWVRALAHPTRTPSLSLHVNTVADRRSKPYTHLAINLAVETLHLSSIRNPTPPLKPRPPHPHLNPPTTTPSTCAADHVALIKDHKRWRRADVPLSS